jgi:hypothetical protein
MRDTFGWSIKNAPALRGGALTAIACGLVACAGTPQPAPAHPSAAPGTAQAVAPPAPPPSPPLTQQALVGTWVEFWALSGQADTQAYEFVADGHFEWRAAAGSDDRMLRRWGRYSVQNTQLVLATEGHEERFGCEGSAVCRVLHEPALEERFTLGECPPNEEAREIDPRYTCVAVEGRAFWRK